MRAVVDDLLLKLQEEILSRKIFPELKHRVAKEMMYLHMRLESVGSRGLRGLGINLTFAVFLT